MKYKIKYRLLYDEEYREIKYDDVTSAMEGFIKISNSKSKLLSLKLYNPKGEVIGSKF